MEVAATVSYARGKRLSPRATPIGGRTGIACGGSWVGTKTAEILQLPRDDNDGKGVWTLLTQQFTHVFYSSYLFKLNHRVVAVGELLINMPLICQNSVCLTRSVSI